AARRGSRRGVPRGVAPRGWAGPRGAPGGGGLSPRAQTAAPRGPLAMSPMNRLTPAELPQFLRRYRFPGGRVRRVRLIHRTEKDAAVELRLVVRESIRDLGADPKRVRLVLRLEG